MRADAIDTRGAVHLTPKAHWVLARVDQLTAAGVPAERAWRDAGDEADQRFPDAAEPAE